MKSFKDKNGLDDLMGASGSDDADGSWVLSLLLCSQNSVIRNRTNLVGSQEINVMPYRLEDAREDMEVALLGRLNQALNNTPTKLLSTDDKIMKKKRK